MRVKTSIPLISPPQTHEPSTETENDQTSSKIPEPLKGINPKSGIQGKSQLSFIKLVFKMIDFKIIL
jgi:hypothetical protein